MDEKELITRVKKSFKLKKSRAEILQGFQKRGYKLAYAEELIKRATRPKKIIFYSILSLSITVLLFLSINAIIPEERKINIANPLSQISFKEKSLEEQNNEIQSSSTPTKYSNPNNRQGSQESIAINYEDIEITPDFIKFLLSEIGADSLHKNLLGKEPSIMNFYIEEKTFYSQIDKTIEVFEGKSETPDLEFYLDKKDLINAVSSGNPEATFKQSLTSGNSWMEIIAGEPELFSKGYLELYNNLK